MATTKFTTGRADRQDDFCQLDIANEQSTEVPSCISLMNPTSTQQHEDAKMLSEEPLNACAQELVEDNYVPQNYISPEIYALLANWEAWCLENPQPVVPAQVYEPFRLLPNSGPPKRFYRTFWRGITRRLVRLRQSKEAPDAMAST